MSSTFARPRAAALPAVLGLILCMGSVGSAQAQVGSVYVALGDSYTAAPLVPNQYGNPIGCGRSDHNYPALVARAFGVAAFGDVSCSGAETRHMNEPQTGLPGGGANPPQFGALRSEASMVTVGIGGNDAGLLAVAQACGQLGLFNPMGTACRNAYAPGGNDTVAARIDAIAPRIAAVLQGIHRRSPAARVAIVGYPDVLPRDGRSCYPLVPLSPDDIRYLDSLIVRLNGVIAGQAALNDAEFVDTYADSAGHDVCTLPPDRWFEGLLPGEPAYPLHPNAKGEASMARSAIRVLSRPRPAAIGGPNAPTLSGLRVSPRRVRVGRPAAIHYRLDRAATVTFTLQRTLSGRRVGRRCEAPAQRNRRRPRCTRYSSVLVSVRGTGRAGQNTSPLRLRAATRRSGRYRITAAPLSQGLRGVPRSTSFRLLPRR